MCILSLRRKPVGTSWLQPAVARPTISSKTPWRGIWRKCLKFVKYSTAATTTSRAAGESPSTARNSLNPFGGAKKGYSSTERHDALRPGLSSSSGSGTRHHQHLGVHRRRQSARCRASARTNPGRHTWSRTLIHRFRRSGPWQQPDNSRDTPEQSADRGDRKLLADLVGQSIVDLCVTRDRRFRTVGWIGVYRSEERRVGKEGRS